MYIVYVTGKISNGVFYIKTGHNMFEETSIMPFLISSRSVLNFFISFFGVSLG